MQQRWAAIAIAVLMAATVDAQPSNDTAATTAAPSTATSEACTTWTTCLAYGVQACDRTAQYCPPCLYTDAKNRNLCYDRVAGTKICPFQGTVADCSTSSPTIPTIYNKTLTPATTTLTPDATSSDSGTVWSGVAIAMTVIAILLFLIIVVAGVLYYRRRSRVLEPNHWLYEEKSVASPIDIPHCSYKGDSKPSQFDFKVSQTTPVMVDSLTQLSACDVMEEAKEKWRDSRPSNILH
ncbi:hypothetical protein THRCLA_09584 [Thraustotheca clavata]|uniref:Secreted protein n=1 Tax=Thraustotheca clavata TaxID=74557 RepID=A0A1V9YVJ9_9STRA|nr:hypothetical protein THRCLA_09584 [Thraustotheca clavata]